MFVILFNCEFFFAILSDSMSLSIATTFFAPAFDILNANPPVNVCPSNANDSYFDNSLTNFLESL
jgi:hypothetical protein